MRGTTCFDVFIIHFAPDLLGHGLGDHLVRGRIEVHAPTGPVPFEPVPDVPEL